jgi:hypothetical protein
MEDKEMVTRNGDSYLFRLDLRAQILGAEVALFKLLDAIARRAKSPQLSSSGNGPRTQPTAGRMAIID